MTLPIYTKKYNKYKNNEIIINGIKFDSKKEANYYSELLLLKKGKVVKDIELQKPFVLQEGFRYKGQAIRAIKYIADFEVAYADGHVEVVDTKGFKTKEYLLKRKMLLFKYPDINFVEV